MLVSRSGKHASKRESIRLIGRWGSLSDSKISPREDGTKTQHLPFGQSARERASGTPVATPPFFSSLPPTQACRCDNPQGILS